MVLLESKQKLQKGIQAPDFSLKGVDGNLYSLDDFEDAKAILIVFMCNHCPYVKNKLDIIQELQVKYQDEGLVVIGINSNDPVQYEEDNFENMQKVARERDFNFVYLFDETQEVARAYGAECTPDPFLFDGERKLKYHGRINDALQLDQEASSHEMDEDIGKVLNNEEIIEWFKPSIGCSIKWKS